MATFHNLLLLGFVLSFIIYLGFSSDFSRYGVNSTMGETSKQQYTQAANLMNQFPAIITVTVAVAFIGTILFPNPFTIFASAFLLFASLAYIPFTVIGALDFPDVLKLGIQTLLTVLTLFLAITWYKGQTS